MRKGFLQIMVLFLFLPGVSGNHPYYLLQADTASINNRNAILFAEARTNPDLTILMARKTLVESGNINYKKGMADASLALGSAWLTKYFTINWTTGSMV